MWIALIMLGLLFWAFATSFTEKMMPTGAVVAVALLAAVAFGATLAHL
jgi:hypothetical protein